MVVVFDLDDTLYDEVDFVKSGFKEISNYLNNEKYYDFMIKVFQKEGSGIVFNKLIDEFNLDISINKLIEIYRFHNPNIILSNETKELLNYTMRFQTGMITDGHYITQKNKFEVLNLDKYIDYPIFTDFFHTRKPESKAYKLIMEKFKDETKFIYISDNPKKDFIAVKKLGWIGIRYKNPLGIYKNFENNTNYEVFSKKEIIKVLRTLNNE